MFNGQQLQDFANSLDSGYVKSWKANSMVNTLTSIPDILADNVRLLNYIDNCLAMEGFSQRGIEDVQKWIIANR